MAKRERRSDQQAVGNSSSDDNIHQFIMALEEKNKELEAANKKLQEQLDKQQQELEATKMLADETQQALEQYQKDLKVAKSTATKTQNALTKKEQELDDISKEASSQAKKIAKQEAQINALKEQVNASSSLTDKQLEEKVLKVLRQKGVDVGFISADGHVFINENHAKDYRRTKKKGYKRAKVVNGNKVIIEAI